MNYHYLDANNQPAGPLSLDEIRALATTGKLPPDPLVCPVGASEWKLLSASGAAPVTEAPAKRPPFSSTLLADFVNRIVGVVSRVLSAELVEKSPGHARHFGHYVVLAGGLLGLIHAIMQAIQRDSFAAFIGGIIFVAILAVAQYAATRFLLASDALIKSTPSRLSSQAFLECVGLLLVLAAAGVLIYGLVRAIQFEVFELALVAVVGSVFLALLGAIALHPRLANVESGEGSAGEEAIGLLAFGLKAVLKVTPVAFALLVVLGTVTLLVAIVAPDSGFSRLAYMLPPVVPIPGLEGAGGTGAGLVVTGALLPLFAYFGYLIASLPLELWRAVLSLPGKLDLLRR